MLFVEEWLNGIKKEIEHTLTLKVKLIHLLIC